MLFGIINPNHLPAQGMNHPPDIISLSYLQAVLLASASHTRVEVSPLQKLNASWALLGKQLPDLGWQPLQQCLSQALQKQLQQAFQLFCQLKRSMKKKKPREHLQPK